MSLVLGGYSNVHQPTEEEQALLSRLDRDDLNARLAALGIEGDIVGLEATSVATQTVAGVNYKFDVTVEIDGADAQYVHVSVFQPLGEGAEPELKDVEIAEGC